MVERVILLKVYEGEVFEVDGNDMLSGDAVRGQVVFVQCEKGGLSAAADARDYFNQWQVFVAEQEIQVLWLLNQFYDYSLREIIFQRFG